MGFIIKKVVGDFDKDPDYQNFSVEINESIPHRKKKGITGYPGVVHFHSRNIRLDISWKDYQVLRDRIIESYGKLKGGG